MQLKVVVEVLSDDGTPLAQGEIMRQFSVQAGYPIAVKMGHIIDAVIDTVKDDTYE